MVVVVVAAGVMYVIRAISIISIYIYIARGVSFRGMVE